MRLLLIMLQCGHSFRFMFDFNQASFSRLFVFSGPCCSGFRYRDHQAPAEIPGRRERSDYDDLLHDRRTGELYFLHKL